MKTIKTYSPINIVFTVFLVLDILVIGLFGFLLYEINVIKAEAKDMTSNLSIEHAKSERLSQIQKTFGAVSEKIAQLDTYVVTEKSLVSFLKIIESSAQSESLSLKTEIRRADDNVDTANTALSSILNVTLTTEGSWQGSQNFLAQIESLPYVLEIRQVSIRKNSTVASKDGVWSQTVGFDVTIVK